MVLHERAVIGAFLGGITWCSITLLMSYGSMNLTLTAHCVGHTIFGRGEPECFYSFDWHFKYYSYERAQVSSIVTIRPRNQETRHLLFDTGPKRPVRLHSGAIVAPRKFHGLSNAQQIFSIPECRAEYVAQFCDIGLLRLSLLTYVQFVCDQHSTEKQVVELCCSTRGVVLYGGCPERHSCFPGMP